MLLLKQKILPCIEENPQGLLLIGKGIKQ